MVYLKPFQFTSHKVFISTSKSIKQGCHIEIATLAYYLTMNGRWFLAISFLFMSSLESQPLPHSKIQMTGSWDVFVTAWSLTPLQNYSESTLQFNDTIEYPRLSYVYRFWTLPYRSPQASAPVPVAGILKGSSSHHGWMRCLEHL